MGPEDRAILLEAGTRDHAQHTQLPQVLTRLGIERKFEPYDGNHGGRIKVCFAENLLPFLTANLSSQSNSSAN